MKNKHNIENQRGMTVAELMVVVAILAVVAVLGVFGLRVLMSGDSVEEDAKAEVRLYASKLNLPVDGIACGNITNKHGLVACTLRSGNTTHQLECIGRYSVGHGCRDQKLSIPQQGEVQ